MLLVANNTDKKKSEYECDRCHVKIGQDNRYGIYIAKPYENIKKQWDFCPKCLAMLRKGVANDNRRKRVETN